MVRPLHPDDRVLVRVPSWLGDAVQAEPVVRALRERARAIGGPPVAVAGPGALLGLLGEEDGSLVRLPHEGRGGESPARWRGRDVAILLSGSFRSAWVARRAGIPRRVGWSRDLRAPLLTDRARPALERGWVPLGLGRAGRPPRLLPRPLGASCAEVLLLVGVAVADPRPRVGVSDPDRGRARARLEREGLAAGEPYLLVNAGGRAGSAKAPPVELLARALAALGPLAPRPVLVAGPDELGRARELAERIPRARPIVCAEPAADLGELAALAAGARTVLSPDSGPRHLAAAVGARVLCLAGPTDPRHSSDPGARTALLRRTVPCGPCHRERCPLEGERALACFDLDPDRIAEALR